MADGWVRYGTTHTRRKVYTSQHVFGGKGTNYSVDSSKPVASPARPFGFERAGITGRSWGEAVWTASDLLT